MVRPGISVVIVSWNTREITDYCLQCMKKAVDYVKDRAKVEVIVVENASEDGTPEMIRAKHKWVNMIPSGDDLGYGKGNNFGYRHSNPEYEYLLLLNNDAFVKRDTLAKALDYFEGNKRCDVLGCKLKYMDGRFQPSAGYLPTPFSAISWIIGFDLIPLVKKYLHPVHARSKEFFKKDRKVGWVMGAFLFMKRKVFEKSEGFDENFFMYMEEVEWCRRVWASGYEIWYTPKFWVTHLDKASAMGEPRELAKIFRSEILGLMYYLRKNYSASMFFIYPIIKVGIFLRLIAFTLAGNSMRRQAYWEILTRS